MRIDLRSDTVTQPTQAMKEAMFRAKLGDDVLGDDPTVIALEAKAAAMFGHEAALFCPSGTMTNQIAIKVHTNAPGEVICDHLAHIYRYEGGGIGFNSGLATNLLVGDRGRFTVDQLSEAIKPDDVHFPSSQLVCLENTCNKGGGSVWNLSDIASISKFCQSQDIPLHLDGARLFNALVATNCTAYEMGQHFDSISICLSKGLGAPVGSLLIGNKNFIHKAKRIRKVMGGGMRQAGILAAAGIYALDHHVERLTEDHKRAIEIANLLKNKPFIDHIEEVDTNIVIFKLNDVIKGEELIQQFSDKNIHLVAMGPQLLRMVTHLDFNDNHLNKLSDLISEIA